MEATNNATKTFAGMESYNVEYYIAKYGTVENLTKDYEGAIEYLRMQHKQYEDNPHKGGRYRREKMKHIQRQAKAIFDELLQVSRAMKEYFAEQAAETPRISTETAEIVNVSVEGEKETERVENAHERKIKNFHYTPEELKRYIIDVYDKYEDGRWVLHHQEDSDHGYFDVIDDKVIYWLNKDANRFSYSNMDFNSPTCGRCFRINSTYQKEEYIVSNEILMEFMCGDTYRYIHKQTVYDNGKYKNCYTIKDKYDRFNVSDFSYTLNGIMQRFNDCYKDYATIIWQSPEFTPQSPETPQTAECIGNPKKLAQTA